MVCLGVEYVEVLPVLEGDHVGLSGLLLLVEFSDAAGLSRWVFPVSGGFVGAGEGLQGFLEVLVVDEFAGFLGGLLEPGIGLAFEQVGRLVAQVVSQGIVQLLGLGGAARRNLTTVSD